MRREASFEPAEEFHLAGMLLVVTCTILGVVVALAILAHEIDTRAATAAQSSVSKPADQAAQLVAPPAAGSAGVSPVDLPSGGSTSAAAPAQPAPAPAAQAAPAAPVAAAAPASAAPTVAAAPAAPAAPASPAQGAATGGDAAAGATVFASTCGPCHPGGNAGMGPALKGISPDAVRATVRAGKAVMPAYTSTQISDSQLADITAYLKTIQ